jgi:serine/threonine-protein kinase
MSLTPGARVGPYEIGALLGSGGMGEVYRARDTKLDRDVALKVLPDSFVHDSDRLARFQREAKVLAALNHPNIAHIHGLEESNGVRALVMELVEGEDLAQRLTRGAIPIDEALPIAKQIAEALEAAHEQGIIHRDLKPANIKVRADGTVKVLDFGLAKAIEPPVSSSPSNSMSPTITTPAMTQTGMILGTAAYMSPEQAAGKQVDKRSDLWSFGVVLMEMLTGRQVFQGETVSHVLASVLKDEPNWAALPAETPSPIRRLLRRCLEKDRRQRLDSAAAARLDIVEARAVPATELSPVTVVATPARRVASLAAALALGVLVAVPVVRWLPRNVPVMSTPLTRLTIMSPPELPLTPSGTARDIAVAPDASFVVYVSGSRRQLVVRRLDQLEASPLPGVANARQPFVSPDSRWIGYLEGDDTLRKVQVRGGAPVTLARIPSAALGLRGAAWIDDATIVVANRGTGLLRVAASGGEVTPLTKPDAERGEYAHAFPAALPGGRALLFVIQSFGGGSNTVALLDLQTGQHVSLVRGGSSPQYVASGHLLYATDGGLTAVRFDAARRAVVGEPVPMPESVSVARNGGANTDIAADGTLVFLPGSAPTALLNSLVWVDRQGRETPLGAPPRAYTAVRLSPDGTHIAVGIEDQDRDVWVWDIAGRTLARLTFDTGLDQYPVWTPDGRRVVYQASRGGAPNLFVRAADGTGAEVRLTDSVNVETATSITPDGAFVIGYETAPETGRDVMRVALTGVTSGPAIVEKLVHTPFEELNGEVSPNGRFLAYQSNESGRSEIYVRPYPQVESGRWQVSTAGGTRPAWTRGGTELVFLDGSNHFTVVPVEAAGSTFHAGTPASPFATIYPTFGPTRPYDVSPDGQRFLTIKGGTDGTTTEPLSLVVVQSWQQELTRLLPPTK